MRHNHQHGFTLLELLVGMAIMGIVLTALVNYFSQSSRVATQSSSRAEMQQEILNAQQLIAGKLKEAWYVYPAGTIVKMTSSELTKRPSGGTTNPNDWLVGTDPILAMILPPRDLTLTCSPPPASQDGCYRFLAYFPIKRSLWVANTDAASSRNPGADTVNADTWILAEYRGTMAPSFSAVTYPPPTAPTVPMSNTPNILSDYIAPTVVTAGYTTAANTYTMFSLLSAAGTATSITNPVTGVNLSLATTRNTGGTTLRLPNATDEYSLTVYPTNLGKVAAN
ncbi:PilW family protein [Deinococcus sp. Leaf326]|uniref:PilW family protein n=1 Tax=Deinococcus sp. Leaf326 TaxID=1736338 RepID=UPI0009E8970C|nr:type II secretion system protein [Deinococcus sp. Leaf326]